MEENNTCYVTGQSLDYVIQFSGRIFVLSLALLSLFFILITLVLSKKLRYWPFKTLLIQCIFEGFDVIGALSLTYQAKCYEQLCSIVGYIMHCSWQTSFCCSAIIVYLYSLSINLNAKYDIYRRQINIWLVTIIIIPYLYLAIPFYYEEFGSTGWELFGKDNHKELFIFCGFKRETGLSTLFYWIFWILPTLAIFIFVVVFACKNKANLDHVQESGIITDEVKLLRKIQLIPKIYFFAWLVNAVCRIIDLFNFEVFYSNIYLYTIYALINLIFELHLTVIAITFFIIYRKVLKIDKIWYNLVRFKIYNPKYDELIIEELNSDFIEDDDDDD